jgi:peptidylprolyl isomerase
VLFSPVLWNDIPRCICNNTGALTPWLGGKHVVFGRVTQGVEVVKQIESLGSASGRTSQQITIVDCGQRA